MTRRSGLNEIETRFGKLLRENRRKAGYSISGLAGLLEMKPAQLSAVERGIGGILSDEQIDRVSRLFGSSAKQFLAAKGRDLEEAFQKQWPIQDALKREQANPSRKAKPRVSKHSPLKKVPSQS